MEVQGSIKVIGEVQEISATFKKRELVVSTDEQYPQTLSIEFIQDKTDLLNKFEFGQNVKVGINLRGREWENPQTKEIKYFKLEDVKDINKSSIKKYFEPFINYVEEIVNKNNGKILFLAKLPNRLNFQASSLGEGQDFKFK